MSGGPSPRATVGRTERFAGDRGCGVVSWVPGLRWLYYVKVVPGPVGERYFGVGVGHRSPRTIELSARRAADLVGHVRFVRADAA